MLFLLNKYQHEVKSQYIQDNMSVPVYQIPEVEERCISTFYSIKMWEYITKLCI